MLLKTTKPQGFIEFDIDEDDNFGQQGRVARKAREVKQKDTRHLLGDEARELYLECLQLVLRRQLWWLVRERGLPPELETVVRDLWDLRVRNFTGLKRAAAAGGTAEESASAVGSGVDSGTDTELFSSQMGSASESDASTRTTKSMARSWTSEAGQSWNLPGLFHCLALCYLGCLSLNLPVRVGHIYEWAKNDQLLFLGAFDSIPKEMTDRLPGSYHRALIIKHASLQGGELHQAVLELILEYHVNYDVVFPPLNTPLQLFHYLRELALPGEPMSLSRSYALTLTKPAETYVHVRAMTRLLHLEFAFNMKKKRFKLLDHPDILLISCIVFSTKLLYPFDDEKRTPVSYRDPSSLQIDWNKWRELMKDATSMGLQKRDINKLEPEDVWTMSDRKIDDYLDWFEETQIKPGRETQELKELFPLAQRRRRVSRRGLTEEEIDERLRTAQSHIKSVAPSAGGWKMRMGNNHAVYRSVDDLPETAKAFYSKAAELSGMSVGKLVKAVYTMEKFVNRWSIREKKKAEPGRIESDQDTE